MSKRTGIWLRKKISIPINPEFIFKLLKTYQLILVLNPLYQKETHPLPAIDQIARILPFKREKSLKYLQILHNLKIIDYYKAGKKVLITPEEEKKLALSIEKEITNYPIWLREYEDKELSFYSFFNNHKQPFKEDKKPTGLKLTRKKIEKPLFNTAFNEELEKRAKQIKERFSINHRR